MSNFFSITNQFKFCGNPFRIDTYNNCTFGCEYCFVKGRSPVTVRGRESEFIDLNNFEKTLYRAFETDCKTRGINMELLRHRVPFHLGGMSDPFQQREFTDKITYGLLTLLNKYEYPVMISTKCAKLPSEYWEILNPKAHAFQISLFSNNNDTIREFEKNTPTVEERISFMKELKNKGFWVGLRIQPLIHLEDALGVVEDTKGIVDYITVEHLKIPTNDSQLKKRLQPIKDMYPFYKPKKSRHYEMVKEFKLRNVNKIKEIAICPVGCGDNDLHEYSESRCCCGIDTIGNEFNNYLKYNTTYFLTGEYNKEDIWIPQSSVRSILNSDCRGNKELKLMSHYVDKYKEETKESL